MDGLQLKRKKISKQVNQKVSSKDLKLLKMINIKDIGEGNIYDHVQDTKISANHHVEIVYI